MQRPLAVLAATVLTALGVAVPISTASAEPEALTIDNVRADRVDSTLTVRYDWDSSALESTVDVLVDGAAVHHELADEYGSGTVTATASRTPSAGPASVTISAHVCDYTPDYSSTACSDLVEWTGTVAHRSTPPEGRSSATLLLRSLAVRAESHASSYARSKFKLWVDANGDHESTRVEVLKAESAGRVTVSSGGTVKRGRWVSPYDGRAVTVGSKLDIDHTVPLAEAWASGAAGWSTTKRTAYANDLGFGASLTAVTKHANRSKGDRDPASWLPSMRSYRCTYVRNWIAVKARWKLSVDPSERTALAHDLVQYCPSDWVTTPRTPKIAKLVPVAAPHRPAGRSTGSASHGSGAGSSAAPAGATARCVDGSLSYSAHRRGTCSHHGGVAVWF